LNKLFAIVLLALGLAGCAEIQKVETTLSNALGVVASTKVNSKSAYIAINVFNAAERTVTTYLKLPPCDGKTSLCRVSGAAAALDRPFNAGIVARNQLRVFMKANPGTLADAGLYNTLVQATSGLQAVMNVYGIGGPK
jgi:hypothetical protein